MLPKGDRQVLLAPWKFRPVDTPLVCSGAELRTRVASLWEDKQCMELESREAMGAVLVNARLYALAPSDPVTTPEGWALYIQIRIYSDNT